MSRSDYGSVSSKEINCEVNLERIVKFVVDKCDHKFYQKLLDLAFKYPDIISMSITSVAGRPIVYEEVEIVLAETEGYSGRHLKCLKDITNLVCV